MRELSIEEKAKAYDEAIERGKQIQNTPYTAHWDIMKEVVEHLLPELKESESERIINLLKMVVEKWQNVGYADYVMDIPKSDILNWLEKQDEQHPKFRIGDTIKKESTGDIVTISDIDLKNREYRLSNSGFIPFKYEHLWELVDQKPTWSEEDERFLNVAINILNSSKVYTKSPDKYEDTINWLKSLRLQNTWKPTDEQMKALSTIYVTRGVSYAGQNQALIDLYNDLKKLRNE